MPDVGDSRAVACHLGPGSRAVSWNSVIDGRTGSGGHVLPSRVLLNLYSWTIKMPEKEKSAAAHAIHGLPR
jgi:Flp pilus assembly protein CpaB